MTHASPLPILIVGGGPAGLGAAWKLHQSGCDEWLLYERGPAVGGLSGSIVDERGFTWDIGGHLLFSHYDLFSRLIHELMPAEDWVEVRGGNVVRIGGRWLPHPIERYLQNLPAPLVADSLDGIVRAAIRRAGGGSQTNAAGVRFGADQSTPHGSLDDLVVRNYGEGLADLFMRPFNRKLWACEPDDLDGACYAEHIAPIDAAKAMRHVLLSPAAEPKISSLRFPRQGGTGTLWQRLIRRLPPQKIALNAELTGVDVDGRIARFSNGDEVRYGSMISTIPIDRLAAMCSRADWTRLAVRLKHTALRLVGIALDGKPDAAMRSRLCMYLPDAVTLPYRVVHMSLLSPDNVPKPGRQWSLLAEISEQGGVTPLPPAGVSPATAATEGTVADLLRHGLIQSRSQVIGTWHYRVEYAQPTPTLDRDAILNALQPVLMQAGIWSRGRFGAWLYEAGNMDHSFMQGYEAAAHLLDGSPELTVWHPLLVNRPNPAIGWDRFGAGVDRRQVTRSVASAADSCATAMTPARRLFMPTGEPSPACR